MAVYLDIDFDAAYDDSPCAGGGVEAPTNLAAVGGSNESYAAAENICTAESAHCKSGWTDRDTVCVVDS